MRSAYVLLVALLFTPTISAHDWDDARDEIGVTVLRVQDEFVHVSWTAAPGAVAYKLYRGPSLDRLELLTQTPSLEYTDAYVPEQDLWYVVESKPLTSHVDLGPMRGKCIAMRGLSGVSVTLANCMPVRL